MHGHEVHFQPPSTIRSSPNAIPSQRNLSVFLYLCVFSISSCIFTVNSEESVFHGLLGTGCVPVAATKTATRELNGPGPPRPRGRPPSPRPCKPSPPRLRAETGATPRMPTDKQVSSIFCKKLFHSYFFKPNSLSSL